MEPSESRGGPPSDLRRGAGRGPRPWTRIAATCPGGSRDGVAAIESAGGIHPTHLVDAGIVPESRRERDPTRRSSSLLVPEHAHLRPLGRTSGRKVVVLPPAARVTPQGRGAAGAGGAERGVGKVGLTCSEGPRGRPSPPRGEEEEEREEERRRRGGDFSSRPPSSLGEVPSSILGSPLLAPARHFCVAGSAQGVAGEAFFTGGAGGSRVVGAAPGAPRRHPPPMAPDGRRPWPLSPAATATKHSKTELRVWGREGLGGAV